MQPPSQTNNSKTMDHLLPPLLLLATLLTAAAQSPATAPTPAGPTNITAILAKAGQFTTFIRLLGATQVSDQVNTQLNNSNQGLTIFAPTDSAFSALPAGTLNSLTDQQKVQLIQFHVIPSSMALSQFQTASNPLRTQAGDSSGSFPLNVTTAGNQVNLTTGVVTTTVSNTIYTDGKLDVYQVDKVLLPLQLFGSAAPAPAPALGPATAKKAAKGKGDSTDDTDNTADSSSGLSLAEIREFTVGASAAVAAFLIVVL